MRTAIVIALLASAAVAQQPAAPPTTIAAVPPDTSIHSTLLLPKDTSKPIPVSHSTTSPASMKPRTNCGKSWTS